MTKRENIEAGIFGAILIIGLPAAMFVSQAIAG